MGTPEQLHGALRQYRHNRGDDSLLVGFDYRETVIAFSLLQQELRRYREGILICAHRLKPGFGTTKAEAIVFLKELAGEALNPPERSEKCPECKGSGKVWSNDNGFMLTESCEECNGAGCLPKEQEVNHE